ncbi:hypothetical protein U1839_09860 [Sphingomonas sp. RT2P30]|uniref:hypothetical protein n=1 Tax=Parasphingomonas halimpatiens TaxID=3096162 RepID=UPI002FCBF507
MTGRTTPAIHDATRAVLPWRIVAGILLHFCVPAYLLACLAAGFLVEPQPSSLGDVVARMMLTGGYFLPAYAALIGVSAIGARMLDPLLRRRRAHRLARDPGAIAATSQRRVADAVRTLRGLSAQARSTGCPGTIMTSAFACWGAISAPRPTPLPPPSPRPRRRGGPS